MKLVLKLRKFISLKLVHFSTLFGLNIFQNILPTFFFLFQPRRKYIIYHCVQQLQFWQEIKNVDLSMPLSVLGTNRDVMVPNKVVQTMCQNSEIQAYHWSCVGLVQKKKILLSGLLLKMHCLSAYKVFTAFLHL